MTASGKGNVRSTKPDDPYHEVNTGIRTESPDVCDRCFNIPWKELLLLSQFTAPRVVPEVLGFQSTCRICVLLQNTDLATVKAFWPQLELESEDQTRDTIGLSGMVSLDISRNGQFIITRLKGHARAHDLRQGEIDTGLIKRWIRGCQNDHQRCVKDIGCRSKLQNLRVIDCEQRIVVSSPLECKFVALSYVWGTSSAYSTGEDNVETPPKTIAQSIYFTRKLGYKYLWVDKYEGLPHQCTLFTI
jgi:hypothetical protein